MRFVIIGGGPAGVQAATQAVKLGAHVTLIEKDVLGGAANLWDCVPSKAMIATGAVLTENRRSRGMGLLSDGLRPDLDEIRERIESITIRLAHSTSELLASQGVTVIRGVGRFLDEHTVVAECDDGTTVEIEADCVLLSTGSRPRIPDWADVDGDRILITRQAYPPKEIPEHLIVIGSGVTGVEFVHMFRCFGSKVSLVVSRQQVPTSELLASQGVTVIRGVGRFLDEHTVAATSGSFCGRTCCLETTSETLEPKHRNM